MNDYNFKAFDKVLVRDSEDMQWSCSFYSHYEAKFIVHICANGRAYKYCIPYDGNEKYLGTIHSPQPKRWRAEKNCEYYFINTNVGVTSDLELYTDTDDARYNADNYFQTRADAQAIADKIKVLMKGGEQ